MRGIKGNTKDDFMYTISYSKFWDVTFLRTDLDVKKLLLRVPELDLRYA